MTKTILEEYLQAYSKQIVCNAELVSTNSELIQKINVLETKLVIATKALKDYAEVETDDWIDSKEVARKALEEMEGVK